LSLSENTTQPRPRRLVSYPELKQLGIPWTRVHIRRLEAKSRFPRHIDLSGNTIVWLEHEIEAFIERKAAERESEPVGT
jgi:predicted DNA-binding transcriptional regulator AlpA